MRYLRLLDGSSGARAWPWAVRVLAFGCVLWWQTSEAADPPGSRSMPDATRMNILLIDIEDCNAAALGCYGNPICRTPNLDKFCRTAVRFDAAYVQAMCCNPSRTSFLTGLRPLTTRVTSNGHNMNEHLPPGTLTLPQLVNFPYMKRALGGNPDIFMKQQPTPQQVREAIAAYYACLTFVDENVGMVLEALEQEGLARNTIVIFLGDHGFHLGDHGFWSKYSMLEATRRAPLIVRVPGAPANGQVCREIVEFVDLVPTIGELARLDLPANLEGASFVPLLMNPERPWKKAMFMVEDDSESGQVVRTKKYSFLEFKKGERPAALFDLEKDPWETVNVVDEPAYAAVRREMAELLHAGWKAALPPGVKTTAP